MPVALEISTLKRKLIQHIRNLSYREGDFTLASGQKSTFYIDMKGTTLHPEGASLIGELATLYLSDFERRVKKKIQGVGGLTLGADPIATAVSIRALDRGIKWPAFIVRKEAKSHGTEEYVEGKRNLPQGSKVIVLEDVVTTGGSSMKAIERLKAEGYEPIAVLTVVDREQGGAEAFRALGIELISLVKLSEIREAV